MSSEIDEFLKSISYGNNGGLSKYESFEFQCERRCSDEFNEVQHKLMSENNHHFRSLAVNSSVPTPQLEGKRVPTQDEEYLNDVQKLSQDLMEIQKEIWVERDMVEEELASYKEIQSIICNVIRKDVKLDRVNTLREKNKRPKQCAHRLTTSRTSRDSVPMPKPLITPVMDPWFFQKTLQEAEKLCESELERVRKCMSMFSINPHATERTSLHSSTDCGSGPTHLAPMAHTDSSYERSNYSKHNNALEFSEDLRFSEKLEVESPKIHEKENNCELFKTARVFEWPPWPNKAISCNGDTNPLPSPTSCRKPGL